MGSTYTSRSWGALFLLYYTKLPTNKIVDLLKNNILFYQLFSVVEYP